MQSSAIRRLSSLTHEAIECNQVQSGAYQASLTKQSRGEAREIAGDAREMRTWPEPRMRDDSMKSSSPPAGVQASPRAIPGRVNSSFASLSYFRGPSNRPSSSRGTCEHGHKAGVHAAGCGEYRDWVQGRQQVISVAIRIVRIERRSKYRDWVQGRRQVIREAIQVLRRLRAAQSPHNLPPIKVLEHSP